MRGFTSIELLLVITLSGILALAAVMLLPSVGDINLNAAAVQVRNDIEYAQQNAMSTGEISGLIFIDNGFYTVYQGSSLTPLRSPLTKTDMIINLSTNYPGVSISGNYTVEFNHMGSPISGGGGSITLRNGSSSKSIIVTANTGRVTIQ